MNITHSKLVEYFKYLADNLKDINGFFRMDLTEIQSSFRSKIEFPALVLESHEGNLEASNVQSTVNDRTFAFTIYLKPLKADYDDQNKKLSSSETIGLKVIARMKHDATLPDHFLYNRFKVNTVSYAKVGPVFNEQLYGYRFVGSILGTEPLVVVPSDWVDLPEICS